MFDTNKQLKHWHTKKVELAAWIEENGISHPDFNAKISEQNAATVKINQLKERGYYNPKFPTTQSIPTLNK